MVSQTSSTASVHPRVCGELVRDEAEGALLGGSSPRVRGTQLGSRAPTSNRRFIPACAGNSAVLGMRRGHQPVHPRVCGELASADRGGGIRAGSSPRVRGTPDQRLDVAPHLRFIPACAGNSERDGRILIVMPVHPRVCGELPQYGRGRHWFAGSSPRVRGTRECACRAGALNRFIPACAGNSLFESRDSTQPPVHPRVCGELADVAPRRRSDRRFIPACAGNSAGRQSKKVPNFGSSPRVRGTRRSFP